LPAICRKNHKHKQFQSCNLKVLLKFIVDTQLPPLLKEWLITKGFNAIHTIDCEQGIFIEDAEIRSIATSENRIINTKDKDFLNHYLVKGSPPKVLLLELGNVKNNMLLNYFRNNFSTIVEKFNAGADLVLFENDKILDFN
jgi:predicted nuclease of predicted toxin-antitoxin system